MNTVSRRTLRWLNDGLPLQPTIWIFGFLLSGRVVMEWIRRVQPIMFDSLTGDSDIGNRGVPIPLMALMAMAVCWIYGLTRACSRNPFCNAAYRDWLQNSPWECPKPLPLGHLLPCWQDAIAIAAFTAPGVGLRGFNLAIPLLSVMTAYTVPLAVSILVHERRRQLYVTYFAAAVAIHFHEATWLWIPALIVSLLATCWATSVSLAQLGTIDEQLSTRSLFRPLKDQFHGKTNWPWQDLTPNRVGEIVPLFDGVLLGCFPAAALWAFMPFIVREGAGFDSAANTALGYDILMTTLPFLGVFISICSLGRAVAYGRGADTPRTWWSRIRKGPFLIPGYDWIFVAPLAIAAAGAGVPTLLYFVGSNVPTLLTATVTIVGILTITLPPSWETFHLTATLRLTAGLSRANESESERRQRRIAGRRSRT